MLFNYTKKSEALECTQRAFKNTLCVFIPYKSTESIYEALIFMPFYLIVGTKEQHG